MALDIPAPAWSWARSGAGGLAPVILALAWAETRGSFDPGAVGDDGCSLGWLQFNTCGGLGAGRPAAELFDPVASAAIAAGYITDRLAANGGDVRDALEPWTTRDMALSVLPQIQAEFDAAGAGPIAGVGGGAGVVGLVVLGLALWLAVR